MHHYLNYITNLIEQFNYLGYWLFFLGAFFEASPVIGTVFPGATMVYLGGIMAYHRLFHIIWVMVFAGLGAILGDYGGYFLGKLGSNWLFKRKIIKPKHLQRGQGFFQKYGNKSILFGRFFSPTRAVVPFVAGLLKMNLKKFSLWNIISGISWAICYALLGYFSGSLLSAALHQVMHKILWPLIMLAAIFFIIWLITRIISHEFIETELAEDEKLSAANQLEEDKKLTTYER